MPSEEVRERQDTKAKLKKHVGKRTNVGDIAKSDEGLYSDKRT